MRGSSLIWVSLTVVATSCVVVLTAVTASPTTVIASVCVPRARVRFTSIVAPTGTLARSLRGAKPDSSAVTS